jgi:hypothetical protein
MNKLKQLYESLPIKIKLFADMLIAANTAALFIVLACKFANFDVDYSQALALFLIYRVCAFMANKSMPLTDENVAFMSSERTLWNLASFAVLLTMWAIASSGWMMQKIIHIIMLMI